jgi:hypothetical protein
MNGDRPCEKCAQDDDEHDDTQRPPFLLFAKYFARVIRRIERSAFKKEPPSLCQRFKKLQIGIPVVPPASKTLPIHLTLFGLPAELRITIYEFLYANGGMHIIRQQLRSGHIGAFNFTNNVNTLLVCRQFYEEAFSLAYQQTHFYYFKSYAFNSFDSLLTRLQPSQMENLRKIAVWSNPYLLEEYFEDVPSAIQLTSITVCCNFMSSRIPEFLLLDRGRWIIEIAKKVKNLKQLHFRTGCRVSTAKNQSLDDDCEFAVDLRGVLDKGLVVGEGFSLGPFIRETKTATLHFNGSGGKRLRSVELMIASVYEVDS